MNYRSNIFNGYFYILYTTYIHCIAFCHITLQHSTLHCIHYIHYIHYTHAMHTHIHAYTHTRTHLYGCIDTWTHRRMHTCKANQVGTSPLHRRLRRHVSRLDKSGEFWSGGWPWLVWSHISIMLGAAVEVMFTVTIFVGIKVTTIVWAQKMNRSGTKLGFRCWGV